MATLAEWQFPNVTRDEAMLDVEFSQSAIRAKVVAVLRFLERARVESRAAAAGRDVVGRACQRFAPRIADQPCQALGAAFLQTRLQRVVAGPDAVLHPLNVAEGRVGARSRRLRAVGVGDHGVLIYVAETVQLRPLVSDVSDVEQQVLQQFVLNAKVVLLDVWRALVGVLRAA